MRIAVTLEVPDPARLYIAQLVEQCDTIGSGLASREAVIAYVQAHLARLATDGSVLPTGPLTVAEEEDSKEAVTWLRAQGKTDGQIRAWLLLQKARFNFGKPRDEA